MTKRGNKIDRNQKKIKVKKSSTSKGKKTAREKMTKQEEIK